VQFSYYYYYYYHYYHHHHHCQLVHQTLTSHCTKNIMINHSHLYWIVNINKQHISANLNLTQTAHGMKNYCWLITHVMSVPKGDIHTIEKLLLKTETQPHRQKP